ncbi:hypothetical protein AB0K89_14625 [Streptomyces cinnamoneus]|uniref:hypothetical protein n=1 Tax=Streptomyces cinnamoneus TaxID=53446 RepID=UPI003435A1DA
MSADLSPLIAATTQWLTRAYAPGGSPLDSALAGAQARQAVTVAAWLRYPTVLDAGLVMVAGPGGSARLDWLVGSGHDEPDEPDETDHAWRTWVDEVVASWAASLLTDRRLAAAAVAAVGDGDHALGLPVEFRRLTAPDDHDGRAAPLLRHPDLVASLAGLHRGELLGRLEAGSADAA